MKTSAISIMILMVCSLAQANPWFEANRRCQDKWPYNKKMKDYCIKQQVDAYNKMPSAPKEIERRCDNEWGTNYEMRKYCIENQNKAKNDIDSTFVDRNIEQKCRDDWGTNYEMIEYCINKTHQPKNMSSQSNQIQIDKGPDSNLFIDLVTSEIKPIPMKKRGTTSNMAGVNVAECPNCKTTIAVNPDDSGKKLTCPRCRQLLIVP